MASPFPSISAIGPLSGPVTGGTQVTIDGQNFAPNCQVKFEGTVATILSNSAVRLVVLTPPGAIGPATIRVINPNQPPAIAQNAFNYVAAPPPPAAMITGVNPVSGPVSGGSQVTIDGQNFAPNCQVKFEGTVATILSNTRLRLVVSTPPGVAGPATIRVINPNQAAVIAQNAFMYVAAPPPPPPAPPPVAMITAVNPVSGPVSGGSQVTIDGQNFAPNCQVKFEGTVAAILSNTPVRLVVITPPGVAGPATIRVINPNQAAVIAQNAFMYVAAPPPPPPAPPPVAMIAGVNPLSGPVSGGTQVTIDGQNFAPNCQVKFEGAVAAILSNTSVRLVVITPPGPAGPATIRVINPNQAAVIAQNAFNYFAAPPSPPPAPPPVAMIAGVNPSSGPVSGGSQVTIDGQNFAPNCQVKFEGAVAAILSNTPVRLVVITPPGPAGPATIRVINPNQAAVIAQNAFNYFAAPPPPPPAPPPVAMITGVNPLSGPVSGGTQVTIDGQNFAPNCQVKFEDAVAAVLSNTAVRLVVISPPGAAGPATIRVINPNQAAVTAQNTFNYIAPPPPPPAPPPLAVTVSAPNGGEILQVGQTFNINWTSNGAASHRVEYSIDGGQNFTPIITNLASDARNFLWNVPALIPSGQTEVQALVRVVAVSAAGLTASDTSNTTFTVKKPPSGQTEVSPDPSPNRQVKRLAAGESVTFDASFSIRKFNDDGTPGPRVAACLTLGLNPNSRLPPGASVKVKPVRDAFPACAREQVLTCSAGETGDCGKYTVTVETQLSDDPNRNTPPGEYTFGIDAFCDSCSQGKQIGTDLFTFVVEKPKVILSVTPVSQLVFAADKAEYVVKVKRIFYTGPVKLDLVFSPPPPINFTAFAAEFDSTTVGNTTQSGAVEIQTFAPKAEITQGTPRDTYPVTVNARPPFGFPPFDFDPATFTLQVNILPDADIAILPPSEKTKVLDQNSVEVEYEGALFRYNFAGDIKLSVADKPPGVSEFFQLGEVKEIKPDILRIKFKLKLTIPAAVETRTYIMKAVASFVAPKKNGVFEPRVKEDKLTLILMPPGIKLKVTAPPEVFPDALFFFQVVLDKDPRFKKVFVRLEVASLLPIDPPTIVETASSAQFRIVTPVDTPPGDYELRATGKALKGNEIDPTITVSDGKAIVTVKRKLGPIIVRFDELSIDIMPGGTREVTLSIDKGGAMGQLGFNISGVTPGLNVTPMLAGNSLTLSITADLTIKPGSGFLEVTLTASDALPGKTDPPLTVNILPNPQPPRKFPRL